MIDETHIYEGIRNKLTKCFPEFVIKTAEETSENAFSIDFVNSKDEKTSKNLLKNTMVFNIAYFPSDDFKNIPKILKIKRKLLYIFIKPTMITAQNKSIYINFDNIVFSFDKNNFNLAMNINIEISQVIPNQAEIINENEQNEIIDFEKMYDNENLNDEYMQEIISDTSIN